jgi:hypothetical protein
MGPTLLVLVLVLVPDVWMTATDVAAEGRNIVNAVHPVVAVVVRPLKTIPVPVRNGLKLIEPFHRAISRVCVS